MGRRRGVHATKGARSRIFNYRCQRKRREQRRDLGSLRKLVISQKSENGYFDALVKFFNWMKKERMHICTSGYSLDDQFCEYLCWLWEEGESRAALANLVSGIRHFEEALQPHLFAARRLITAWDKNEFATRSFPLTPLMRDALAGAGAVAAAMDAARCCAAASLLL